MTRVIQRSALLLAAGLMASAPVYAQTQSEEVGSAPAATFGAPDLTAPIWTRGVMGTVLFDNGPLVNSVGTGAGGADESVLQTTSLGMTTLGFGHQVLNGNRMADDFTIPPGETWIIDEFVFFAYQTGSTTTSTMTGVNMRIWDGDPSLPGSTVVFGDTSTNVMTDTAFTNIYRITETTVGANNRPIMAQTADTAGLVLPAGTYWVDWQSDGSLASGPWAPPITITGTATTGNALQSLADNGATWQPAVDGGTDTPQQGLPFLVVGALQVNIPETQPVPTLGTAGLVALVLMLALFAAMVLRRRA